MKSIYPYDNLPEDEARPGLEWPGKHVKPKDHWVRDLVIFAVIVSLLVMIVRSNACEGPARPPSQEEPPGWDHQWGPRA
jgi:hypothetical protein